MEVRGCGVDRLGWGERRTKTPPPPTAANWPFHSDVHASQFSRGDLMVSEAGGKEDLPQLRLQDLPCFYSQGLSELRPEGPAVPQSTPILPPSYPSSPCTPGPQPPPACIHLCPIYLCGEEVCSQTHQRLRRECQVMCPRALLVVTYYFGSTLNHPGLCSPDCCTLEPGRRLFHLSGEVVEIIVK